jgi:hypothetical protein
MKKALLSAAVIVFIAVSAYAKTTFVMLPMVNGGVSDSQLDDGYNSFYLNLVNSKKFNIADRDKLKNVLSENKLELSGLSENKSEITKIGKLLGADKLISSKIFQKAEKQVAIFIQVIDVTTAQVELTKEIYYYNYNAEADGRYCAAEIAAKYPLTGEVLGKSGDVVIINLGDTDGLKEGDRIFVARNEVMYGDNKEVLYVETKRVGVLRVTGLMGSRAKAKTDTLTDPKDSVRKGDIVSPEPIPQKETVISKDPLLSNVAKGKLILDDDMERKQYLSPTYNSGDSYVGGKLNLCSTNNNSGHTYAFYPIPYDNLMNFVMEGDVEFRRVKADYNRFDVVFRCNGNYLQEIAYTFYWQDKGSFAVYFSSMGQIFNLVPLQASSAINRGEAVNRFRIVSFGSKFDLYLNDQFIVGFEDERLEKGVVGFECANGGHVMVDNVRIWDAVQK